MKCTIWNKNTRDTQQINSIIRKYVVPIKFQYGDSMNCNGAFKKSLSDRRIEAAMKLMYRARSGIAARRLKYRVACW